MTKELEKIRKQFTRKVRLALSATGYSKHSLWLDVVEKKVGKSEYEKLWQIALKELR